MRRLPAESADLVFADPPYNLQLSKQLRRPDDSKVDGVDDDWDKFASFQQYDSFTAAWLAQCRRVLKPSGALWVIGTYHNIYRVGAIVQDLGFWLLNDVVWVKSNPMPNFRGTRFGNAHETLLWAAMTADARYTFNYRTMKAFNDDLQMRSDWRIPICAGGERLKDASGAKLHPTQKPLALLLRIIMATTNPGDIVLDPFVGSGTSAAAAKLLNRRYIGIDQDDRYIQAARRRLARIRPLDQELTASGLDAPRPKVPFGQLVAGGYIAAGTCLLSADRIHKVQVMADGSVRNGRLHGSIHQVSAGMLGKQSSNGWSFWNIERQGRLVSIDEIRQQYLAGNKAAKPA